MPTSTRPRQGKLAAITVRRLPISTVTRLKALAKTKHHSLEAEVRAILIAQAAQPSAAEWLAEAERLRAQIPPWQPGMPTAADLVRDGRDRDD
jgi:plasmid stability protein